MPLALTLSCIVSELQALQLTTAERVSSFEPWLQNATHVNTFIHCVRAAGFAAHNSTAGEFPFTLS